MLAAFLVLARLQKVLLLVIWWSWGEVVIREGRCVQDRMIGVHLHSRAVRLRLPQMSWEGLSFTQVYSGNPSAGHDNFWKLVWPISLHPGALEYALLQGAALLRR